MSEEPGRLQRFFGSVEEAARPGWRWLLLLVGWILARNLLEGILEHPHQMGFDWRGEISFAMFFLHFPLFYLALFVVTALWIHWLSGRSLARVAGAVSVGFAVLLIVPILDALVSSGRGYDLRYLVGFEGIFLRFWDPTAAHPAISPGQRVEVVLACVLCAAYVYASRRGVQPSVPRAILRAILAVAGFFVLAALLGAWPSLFAQWLYPKATPLADPNMTAFRGPGLVPGESRRLALVVAMPLLLALPLFLQRMRPDRVAGVLRAMNWSRLFYYTGLVPAGVWLAWLVYHEHLPRASITPVDAVATCVLWVAMVCAFFASLFWNDLNDCEADAVNEPHRPLPQGVFESRDASTYARAAAGLALFLSLCVSYHAFLLMIACLFLAWLYSCPPVRLKRWPFVATFTLAILSLISLATGFSLYAQEMTPLVLPRRVALFVLVGVTLGFVAKDLKDAPGDRRTGVVTLATLLPERGARIVTALLVALAFLLVPIFLPMGWIFVLISALFALAGVLLTLRVRRPDSALLVGLLVFGVVLGFFLTRHKELVQERVPSAIRDLQADMIVGERGVRLTRLWVENPRNRELPPPGPWARERLTVFRDLTSRAREWPALWPAWEERLGWLRVQAGAFLDPPRDADEGTRAQEIWSDLGRLQMIRPLRTAYWDTQVSLAQHWDGWERGFMACTQALALGLRPGDFLRNRAALRLARGAGTWPAPELDADELASIGRDLTGAFLYGGHRATRWVLLGDWLATIGERTRAHEAYREALRTDVRSVDGWSGLGQTFYASGELEDARVAFEEARRLDPFDPWVLNNLGVVLRDLGRVEEAHERFLEAHQRGRRLIEPHYNLGRTCELLGRPDEARQWYERGRAVRPGFPPLEDALRALDEREGP